MTERPGMRGGEQQSVGTGAEGPLRGPAALDASRDRMAESTEDRDAERRRRRALFLRELHEAKELRARVQPRRARAARMREHMRMRTFRWQ